MKYKASLIIPTYNREVLLKQTLNSVLLQKIDKNEFEVIICDDGSSDNTKEMVNTFKNKVNLKYYYQEDKGFRAAMARNLGINNAEGEVSIFIDSGIILEENFLESHIKVHEGKDNLAVIGYMYGFETSNKNKEDLNKQIDLDDINKTLDNLKKHNLHDEREIPYKRTGDDLSKWPAPWALFWTCNVSAKTEFLRRVGGFDESYNNWGCEDIDLALALFTNGAEFKLCRDAIGIHLPHEKSHDLETNPRLFIQKGQAKRLRLYEKYRLHEILLWHNVSTFDLNDVLIKNNSVKFSKNYKMLVSDVDGTLTDFEGNLSKENYDMITSMTEKDKIFTLASGRGKNYLLNLIKNNGIKAQIIALNGAHILDQNGETLWKAVISSEDANEIVEKIPLEDVVLKIFTLDHVYTNMPKNLKSILTNFAIFKSGDESKLEEGIERYKRMFYLDSFIFDDPTEVIEMNKDTICKIEVLTTDQELLKSVKNTLGNIEDISITSSYINNFEITNAKANKGEAVKVLADELDIELKDIIAVGDNLNDLDMLNVAGLSVAVGNCHEVLLRESDYVVKSNLLHGVAEVIEKFMI